MASWKEASGKALGRVDWIAVAIFWATAGAWSAFAVRWSPLDLPGTFAGMRIDDAIFVGWGPAFGAIVASLARPTAASRTTTLGGKLPWAALVALCAPVLTAAIVGLTGGESRHAAGALFALTVVVYCVGEELGWRGWLFDALGGLPLWQSALVTAVLWYAWHWTFLDQLWADPVFAAQFGLFVLIASLGLAQATSRSRSVGIAAAAHAAAKVMIAPGQIAAMVALIGCAVWASRKERPVSEPRPA